MSTLVYKLLTTQTRFVNSKKKHVFYSGGMGSGKSRALCYALVKQAVIPGNTVLLCRKTLVSLKKSTLMTLIGGDEPVLPSGSYTYNRSDSIIKLNGGGQVFCCGLEDPMRIRSFNLGAAFVDEVTELTENEYKEISYRLRLPAGSRQLFSAGNPSGQNHWAYKYWFLDNNKPREVITASSLENHYLPSDYVEELNSMDENIRKRLRDGLWIDIEGIIFGEFDRKTHVRRLPELTQYDECYVGVDFGYKNPTALVTVGVSGGRLEVPYEWYKAKCLLREIVAEAKKINERFHPTAFVYDPSAASLGAELENGGLTVIKANNDVAGGIELVRNRLRVRDGQPELFIDDRCTNLIREIENYAYQQGTEKPLKINDHGVDALRYVCAQVCENTGVYIHPTFPDDEPDKPDAEVEWIEMEELGVQQ